MSVRSWFPDEVDADVYGLPLVLSPGFNVSISLFKLCAYHVFKYEEDRLRVKKNLNDYTSYFTSNSLS